MRRLVLYILFCSTPLIGASIGLNAYVGAGAGLLTEEKATQVVIFPTAAGISFLMHVSSWFSLSVFANAHQWKTSYQKEKINYQGTYAGTGGGGSFNFHITGNSVFTLGGEQISQSSLVVKSSESASINGTLFKHSTFTVFSGGPGMLVRMGIVNEKSDDQFSPDQRMRIGLYLNALQQSFNLRTTQITTNDSEKTPGSFEKSTDTVTFQTADLSMVIGFSF